MPNIPTYLGFFLNPDPAVAGGLISEVQAAVLNDDDGVTADSDGILVTISIEPGSGAPGAVLSGTTSKNPVNGMLSFADLSINLPNGSSPAYQLTLTSVPPLIPATCTIFAVTGPPAPAFPLNPLYPDTDALPFLADTSSRYRKLKTDAERADQIVVAELLLGLTEPVYTGRKASEIMYGIALQVIFQLDQGTITAQQMRSIATNAPGNSMTTYRDRYLHPGAADIVNRATGRAVVGFTPMASGT